MRQKTALRENAAIALQNRHDEVRASKRWLGSNNLLFYSLPPRLARLFYVRPFIMAFGSQWKERRGRGGWNSICVTEDLYHSIPPSIFLVFCDRLTRFRSRHLIGHLARPTPTLDFRWKGLKGHSAVIQSFANHCTHFFCSSC